MIYAEDPTHSSLSVIKHLICSKQQLEMVPELEFALRDTPDWRGKWLVDFNARKTQLVLFDQSNNPSANGMKMDGSSLEKKLS